GDVVDMEMVPSGSEGVRCVDVVVLHGVEMVEGMWWSPAGDGV
ncbi:hypothetical protein Tco_0665698, partial [Tanacetum coccineum]